MTTDQLDREVTALLKELTLEISKSKLDTERLQKIVELHRTALALSQMRKSEEIEQRMLSLLSYARMSKTVITLTTISSLALVILAAALGYFANSGTYLAFAGATLPIVGAIAGTYFISRQRSKAKTLLSDDLSR